MADKFFLWLLALSFSNLMSPLFLCAQVEPYRPIQISEPIVLDGKLTETVWQQAHSETAFMQVDPVAGANPSEKTEIRLIYNDDFLYAGVRCYDSRPDKLISLNLKRDFDTGQEDGIAFVLDTYNDKSSGLAFITNLLGARWDEEFTADGGNENPDYNTFWDTRAHIDSAGYTIELRIPFSSLRFEARGEIIRMGFKVVRLIKRKNEYLVFPACDPKIDNPYFKVSLAREMEFSNLKGRKPFYLTPYIIGNYYEENKLASGDSVYRKSSGFMAGKNYSRNTTLDKVISNVGLDLKYGLSKNFTLDVTLNTDFAQAEADNVIINLSKYEVNLPEKRSFFLESRNYLGFSTSNGSELFVSRTIGNEKDELVPILAGARITGKSRGWQMGLLDMQTTEIAGSGIDPHNFFVFRTRKDIDSTGSFIGGIFTNRMNTGRKKLSDQTLAIDIVKKLNDHVVMVGAVSSTFTDADVKPFANRTYYNAAVFRSAKTGMTWQATADLVGKDFHPVMGYIDESDYAAGGAGIGYTWAGNENGSVTYWQINNNNSYRWKLSSGKRETFYTECWPGITFRSGAEINFSVFEYRIDSLFEDWELNSNNSISAGTYTMFTNSINLVAPQKSIYNAVLSASYGGFYGGRRFFISPEAKVYLGRHVNMYVTYEYNNIQFDRFLQERKHTRFESNLVRVGISYMMSTKFSVILFAQFDDLNRKLQGNLRLRYNPREGTDLYIVYNRGMNISRSLQEPRIPELEQQAVTIKFLKTFAF